ncbi:MAG: hypothetical protein JRI47_05725 [Deltaproteobacteria bacterium]|nr:hypothetical protein [Deltaproteobacteria bacterium]
MENKESLKPIGNLEYLEKLLAEGYTIKGPRQDPSRDLISFKAFVKRGKEFAPEDWLESSGYEFVEPNTFTKGRRIAYKLTDDIPDERFNSNYSLVKDGREVSLYLEVEVPEIT